jgi:hypothetical protein
MAVRRSAGAACAASGWAINEAERGRRATVAQWIRWRPFDHARFTFALAGLAPGRLNGAHDSLIREAPLVAKCALETYHLKVGQRIARPSLVWSSRQRSRSCFCVESDGPRIGRARGAWLVAACRHGERPNDSDEHHQAPRDVQLPHGTRLVLERSLTLGPRSPGPASHVPGRTVHIPSPAGDTHTSVLASSSTWYGDSRTRRLIASRIHLRDRYGPQTILSTPASAPSLPVTHAGLAWELGTQRVPPVRGQ